MLLMYMSKGIIEQCFTKNVCCTPIDDGENFIIPSRVNGKRNKGVYVTSKCSSCGKNEAYEGAGVSCVSSVVSRGSSDMETVFSPILMFSVSFGGHHNSSGVVKYRNF